MPCAHNWIGSSRWWGCDMPQQDLKETAAFLKNYITVMEHYLQVRLGLRDWHGVMDAAADLRELEAKLQVVQEIDKEDGL